MRFHNLTCLLVVVLQMIIRDALSQHYVPLETDCRVTLIIDAAVFGTILVLYGYNRYTVDTVLRWQYSRHGISRKILKPCTEGILIF